MSDTKAIPTKVTRRHADGKAARIRKLLVKGKSYSEIAETIGTTVGYVYSVGHKMKNNPSKVILLATSNTSIKTRTTKPKARATKPKGFAEFVPTFVAERPSLWERIKAVFA
jgi:DNA invertase Pin-like site-specific DNA recombinase